MSMHVTNSFFFKRVLVLTVERKALALSFKESSIGKGKEIAGVVLPLAISRKATQLLKGYLLRGTPRALTIGTPLQLYRHAHLLTGEPASIEVGENAVNANKGFTLSCVRRTALISPNAAVIMRQANALAADARALAITPRDAGVLFGYRLQATAAQFQLQRNPAQVLFGRLITTPPRTYGVSAKAAILRGARYFPLVPYVLTLVKPDIFLLKSLPIVAGRLALTITPRAAFIERDATAWHGELQTLALSFPEAKTLLGYRLVATRALFTITRPAQILFRDRNIRAVNRALLFTHSPDSLKHGHRLYADPTPLDIVRPATALLSGDLLRATKGAYTLTARPAVLQSSHNDLQASRLAVAITPSAALMSVGYKLAQSPVTPFALTRPAQVLFRDRHIDALPRSLAMTGRTVFTPKGFYLGTQAAQYLMAASSMTVIAANILRGTSTPFTITPSATDVGYSGGSAPPSLRGVGAAQASIGAITLDLPLNRQIGDLTFIFVQTSFQAPAAITGWTAAYHSSVGSAGSANAVGLYSYRRFEDASTIGQTTVTVPDSGDHQAAFAISFANVSKQDMLTSGYVVSTTGVSQLATVPTLTTTKKAMLSLQLIATSYDNNISNAQGNPSGHGLSGYGLQGSVSTDLGTGGGVKLWTGSQMEPAIIPAATLSLTASSSWVGCHILLSSKQEGLQITAQSRALKITPRYASMFKPGENDAAVAPSARNAGAVTAGAAAGSATMPAHAVGDLLIALVASSNNNQVVSAWNKIDLSAADQGAVNGTAAGALAIEMFWIRATSTTTAASFTAAASVHYIYIVPIIGAEPFEYPFEDISTNVFDDPLATHYEFGEGLAQNTYRYMLQALASDADVASNVLVAGGLQNPIQQFLAQLHSGSTTTGSGAGLTVAGGPLVAEGWTGVTSMDLTFPGIASGVTVIIKPRIRNRKLTTSAKALTIAPNGARIRYSGVLEPPSFISTGVISHQGNAGTFAPGRPAGVKTGDLMLLMYQTSGTVTSPNPAGWTALPSTPFGTGTNSAGNSGLAMLYKFAESDTPSVPTFVNGANLGSAVIMAFRYVDPADPFDVIQISQNNAAVSVNPQIAPDITTTDPMTLVVGLIGTGSGYVSSGTLPGATVGANSSVTDLLEIIDESYGTNDGLLGAVGVKETPGAVTGFSFTTTLATALSSKITIALRPTPET